MSAANPPVDPANVVQALVHTLLDVFDATRDLYNTLKNKEKRDYENSLRAKGYPDSRRIEYIEDGPSDEGIVMDKAAVTRQFDIGFQDIGTQFAVGDVISQTALQSQIITLQAVIITTFLYGPTSPDPISRQISSILAASRTAGTVSVDVLAAQYQRQLPVHPPISRSARSSRASQHAPPYPLTQASTSSASTALIKSRREPDTLYPAKTTIMDVASRPKVQRSDTESTSFSGPTAYGTQSIPPTQYCLYALDLQRHPSQALSSSITDRSTPYCPYCNRDLNLSPGRSWEIFKDDDGTERRFHIQNRFVVKCHRDGVDGGYACVLCSKSANVDTVCGDVKALIRHVWIDHSAVELDLEEDVEEVVEKSNRRRRDSMLSFTEPPRRGDRRSVSLGPSRGKASRRSTVEREVETIEIRPLRRDRDRDRDA